METDRTLRTTAVAAAAAVVAMTTATEPVLRVRFQIIGNARIENVGKSQSCMVSKLPIICKQTVGVRVTGSEPLIQMVGVGDLGGRRPCLCHRHYYGLFPYNR